MGALQQEARRRGQGKAGKWRDAECGEVARCVMERVTNDQLFKCVEISRKVLDRARARGSQFLMSAEGLSLNGAPTRLDRARKLQHLFGACQILIVIRNPFNLVRSAYSQYLKREIVRAPSWRMPTAMTIDEWLLRSFDERRSAPYQHLQYAETIAIFESVFGTDSVHVAVFESLRSDPEGFGVPVCRILGIDAEVGARLTRDKRANPGLSGREIRYLQSLNRHPWSRLKFNLTQRKSRFERLRILSEAEAPSDMSGMMALQEESAKAVCRLTAEGNRLLESRRGLPLHEFGYPL